MALTEIKGSRRARSVADREYITILLAGLSADGAPTTGKKYDSTQTAGANPISGAVAAPTDIVTVDVSKDPVPVPGLVLYRVQCAGYIAYS